MLYHYSLLFRCKQFLSAELMGENVNRRGASIPLSCKTRWGSHLRQFKKLLAYKEAILAVMQNPAASDYVIETASTSPFGGT